MAREHIWTVRGADGRLLGASTHRMAAVWDSQRNDIAMSEQTFYWLRDRNRDEETVTHGGYTLTREPLPTPAPADAAVERLMHFVIPAESGLDPVRVICVDHEPGKGTLVVQCYNEAWTTYFGAMSGKSLLEFIASVDSYYLGGALRVRNGAYGERIANAVILAARERVAALTAARGRGGA